MLNVLFYVGAILVFAWLVWGVFAYILARGEKEDLAKARARIMWALIGFLFLIISFAISQYAQGIFPLTTSKDAPVEVKQVTTPPPIP
jgi:NADH:ubiquinone oxidoreductase subunit 6 (subunit J)